MWYALMIAKEGYGSGDPQVILNWPIDIFLDTLEYIGFMSDYNIVAQEINREE